MRKLWLTGMLILCSGSCYGQGKVVKVRTGSEPNSESKDVLSKFNGEIGSTLRYSLVTETGSESILALLNCLSWSDTVVACSLDIALYPEGLGGISTDLVGGLAVGTKDYVADSLFNNFVSGTTDEQIAIAEKLIRTSVDNQKHRAWTEGYEEGRKHCATQNN